MITTLFRLMKVLALKWRRLGDTALWTSALEALRSLPECQVDIAYPEAYAALFENDPRFARQYHLKSGVRDSWPLYAEMREARYDWILVFHASRRGLWSAYLSGAKKRALHHHSREGKNYFSQCAVPARGQPGPATERDLNLVRALGWQGPSPSPKLVPNAGQVEKASLLLSSLKIQGQKPLVVMSPFASRPAKQWPLSRYSELGTILRANCDVVFMYESERTFRSVEDRRCLERAGTLIHTPRLSDALGILAKAQLFVGSDSGLKHVACAYDIRTLTLFGPESLGEWHPYDIGQHPVFQQRVGCRDHDPEDPLYAWCGVEVCPMASHGCLLQTSVANVLGEIEFMLKLPT